MSFLTYTSHPVLFAASVGGVTLGVTLLLLPWKQISFGDSWSNSFLSSRGINSSLSREPIERENNCKVVSNLEELKRSSDYFLDYIAISCSTKGIEGDSFLIDPLLALFPRNLFKDSNKLTSGQKLSIQTQTEEIDEKFANDFFYKTKFQSSQFVTDDFEIIGKWKNYDDLEINGKNFDIVTLTKPFDSNPIYFVYDVGIR